MEQETPRRRPAWWRPWLLIPLVGFTGLALAALGAGAWWYVTLDASLPGVEAMAEYEPSRVTQVLSAEGHLLGEYYIELRRPVRLADCPKELLDAVIATEDVDFYLHPGVNLKGIFRAAVENFRAGRVVQGGSTITQQVARELFLNREQKLLRKIKEALLAVRMERRFTKEQILEIYLNHLYLGSGAYGMAAAGEVYFGKQLADLTLGECALLAGLYQGPSAYSPHNHLDRALRRRHTVLAMMREAGFITSEQARSAEAEPVSLREREPKYRHASYFMERLRQELERELGVDALHRGGLRVHTTISLKDQKVAEEAVRWGARQVDRRRGLRPLALPPEDDDPQAAPRLTVGAEFFATLSERDGRKITLRQGEQSWEIELPPERWGGDLAALPEPGTRVPVMVEEILYRDGRSEALLELAQEPEVEGALLCLDPTTGHVRSWVGGTDFSRSRWDRVVQSRRQPGSGFKPIIYCAALDSELTPADVIYDSPIVEEMVEEEGTPVPGPTPDPALTPTPEPFDFGFQDEADKEYWKPGNFSDRFYGATTVRRGLEKSRNLVTIKILRQIGVNRAVQYARLLGIRSPLAEDLSLALGSSGVTMLELARAYTAFPGAGQLAQPMKFTSITDPTGRIIRENRPTLRACLEPTTAYQVVHLLEGVVQNGTGWRAKALGRPVAGKTGTTNDYVDAWFTGFTPGLLTCVWVGLDEPEPLGELETGSKAAAPIWVRFMEKALADEPKERFAVPPGIVFAGIDAETGRLADATSTHVINEAFKSGTEPTRIGEDGLAGADLRTLDLGWDRSGLGDSAAGGSDLSDLYSSD